MLDLVTMIKLGKNNKRCKKSDDKIFLSGFADFDYNPHRGVEARIIKGRVQKNLDDI